MDCKFTSTNLSIPHKLSTSKSNKLPTSMLRYCKAQSKQESFTTSTQPQPQSTTTLYKIKFRTLQACKLGISRYPDFDYNAEGGIGTGTGEKLATAGEELLVNFDIESLYIPALSGATTRFLGLSLPPFLKIEIAPEVFKGCINSESGMAELEFKAKFRFSI